MLIENYGCGQMKYLPMPLNQAESFAKRIGASKYLECSEVTGVSEMCNGAKRTLLYMICISLRNKFVWFFEVITSMNKKQPQPVRHVAPCFTSATRESAALPLDTYEKLHS